MSHPEAFGLVGNGATTMISRSSRLLHAALVVVCGAGIVYAPVQAQTSLTLQRDQPMDRRVPPNPSRDWNRYGGLNQACGVSVQFVRDDR